MLSLQDLLVLMARKGDNMISIAESYDPEYPTRVPYPIGQDIFELVEMDMLKAYGQQKGKLKLLSLLQGRLAALELTTDTQACLATIIITLGVMHAIEYGPRLIEGLVNLFRMRNNHDDIVEDFIEFD